MNGFSPLVIQMWKRMKPEPVKEASMTKIVKDDKDQWHVKFITDGAMVMEHYYPDEDIAIDECALWKKGELTGLEWWLADMGEAY